MYNVKTYFDNVVNEEIAANRLAGANVMVVREGKELFFESYGMADVENGRIMKRDAVFRMFSMSKPVTAAAAMLLLERGVLDLYTPVSRYLPGFKNQIVSKNGMTEPAVREVTVRDLLNMTSGIAYPGDDSDAARSVAKVFAENFERIRNTGETRTVELCNALGACPLAFQPGERWMYGFSADILGAVVEVASGRPLGKFLKEEFFIPLEMNNTGFTMSGDMRERLAQTYEVVNGERIIPFGGSNLGIDTYPDVPTFESGGAGLLSTIDDYSHFAMMLANGGTYKGKRILGKQTVDFMRTNALSGAQISLIDWESMRGYGYGNLMRVLVNKSEAASNATIGEFGWDGWMGTYFIADPVNKSALICLIQRINAPSDEFIRKLRAVYYGMLE